MTVFSRRKGRVGLLHLVFQRNRCFLGVERNRNCFPTRRFSTRLGSCRHRHGYRLILSGFDRAVRRVL